MKPEIFQNISNILILVGVILTAIGGYGSYYFGKRGDEEKDELNQKNTTELNIKIENLLHGNDSLRKDLEPFKDFAKKMYPTENEQKALNNLKDDLDKLKNEVKEDKKIVKTFTAEMKVKFSGNWDKQPYPDMIISPVNQMYFVVLVNSKNLNQKIELYATEPYQFTKIGDNQAEFFCRLAVKDGQIPVGQKIDYLKNFDKVDIFIPFVEYENIKDSKITMHEMDLNLLLNNRVRGQISGKFNHVADVKLFSNRAWATAGLTMDKHDILDYFEKD